MKSIGSMKSDLVFSLNKFFKYRYDVLLFINEKSIVIEGNVAGIEFKKHVVNLVYDLGWRYLLKVVIKEGTDAESAFIWAPS